MRLHKISILFFCCALSLLLFIPFCSQPISDSEDLAYINHHDSVTYVGMELCASCHLDKHQTFIHTGMGLSFDDATQEKSAAHFSLNHFVYDSIGNFYYVPFWKKDLLYIKEFQLLNGDTSHLRIEKIDYIIGSGQHTNSHLIRKGDYLVQAPFTWYNQKQKLDFPPGFENGNNSRFTRIIDLECMSCHNSLPVMKASPRAFSNVPKGIGCERCHGPGSAHVAFRQAGGSTIEPIDRTIVNPAKLSWQRQIDVCQRCHLQGNNVLKPGKSFMDFRPGMVLSDVFEVYLPRYADGSLKFNMANHADRLQNSQCFIASNASKQNKLTLTCISCHNPHVSVKKMAPNHFNHVCTNCHNDAKKSLCLETETKRMAAKNDCVACHMPVSGTEDIPHVTVHDHRIGVYADGKVKPNTSKVNGLYCVNNQNPTDQMLIKAYLTYFEKFDPLPIYQQKALELLQKHPDPLNLIHYHYQKQAWTEIRKIQLASGTLDFDAISCYRIGKAFHNLGDYINAINWLELAVFKDDQYFEYKSELSASLLKTMDYKKAEASADACLKQFPEYVPALNNKGFACLMQGNFMLAQTTLLLANKLDPNNITTMENLVLLYSNQNKLEETQVWLRKIVQLQPNHEKAKSRLLTP